MKTTLVIGTFISLCLLVYSCDTPLNEYQPQNEGERQITELLITFQNACNNGDIGTLQALFHDNGTYESVRGGQITKSQIAETDPDWWAVSGKIQMSSPEITIGENECKVFVNTKHGAHFKAANVFNLVKENGKWLIMSVK
jgi:hypothetical protein